MNAAAAPQGRRRNAAGALAERRLATGRQMADARPAIEAQGALASGLLSPDRNTKALGRLVWLALQFEQSP
jgi:hypothetical protein